MIKLISNIEDKGKIAQYLYFQKNIIAISSNLSPNLNKISFYNIANSPSSTCLGSTNIPIFDKYELHQTKNNSLFIIGYMNEFQDYLKEKEEKKLGIFLLNLENRLIEKKASFKYNNFMLDKKEDKIFLVNNGSIIAYDLRTNTLKQKKVKQPRSLFEKMLLVDNYILPLTINDAYKWDLGISNIIIIDKDLKSLLSYSFKAYNFLIGELNFSDYVNGFVKLTDNKYFLYSESHSNSTDLNFWEINFKGNENLLKERKRIPDLFEEKRITIKECNRKVFSVFPLNEKNFVVNFEDNIFYIYRSDNFQVLTKIKMNIPLYDNVQMNEYQKECRILSMKTKGIYLEIIYVKKNNDILLISNNNYIN